MTGSTLDRIDQLVRAGEDDLATIEVIRAIDAWWPEPGTSPWRLPALARALRVLGALRLRAGDLEGAAGSLRWSVELARDVDGAAADLALIEAQLEVARSGPQAPEAAGPETVAPDQVNPWTAATLAGMQRFVDVAGKDVLEIGGALPRDVTRELGVARWVACELRCEEVSEPDYEVRVVDATAMPFADESFDVIFSSCAFEHFGDVPGVLAECRRVLRHGGVLYADYGPIWSHAVGHHLYTWFDGGLFAFTDPVLPRWSQVALRRSQLRRYVELTRGERIAAHVDWWLHEAEQTNELPEAGHRRAFWNSGLDVVALEPRGSGPSPTPALLAELQAVHPDGSDFTVFGYSVALRKPRSFDFRLGADRARLRVGTAATPVSVVVPMLPGMPSHALHSLGASPVDVDLVVVHGPGGLDDDVAALVDAGGVRTAMAPRSDLGSMLAAGIGAAAGEHVFVLHPADRLVLPTLEALATPLLDDAQLVATVAGSVPVDTHGLVAHGAVPTSLARRAAVVDGGLIGDAHLLDPEGSVGIRSSLVRRSVLEAALAEVMAVPALREPRVLMDALWLSVVARGAVAAVPDVGVHVGSVGPWWGRGPGRAERQALVAHARTLGFVQDPVRDVIVTEAALGALLADGAGVVDEHLTELADLSGRLAALRAAVASGPAGASTRPVTVVLPVHGSVAEATACVDALRACIQLDLCDLLILDASGGALRPAIVELGGVLAEWFDGDISVLDVGAGRDDGEALALAAEAASTEYLLVVDDPAALVPGWLVPALVEARTTGTPFVADGNAALVRRVEPVAVAVDDPRPAPVTAPLAPAPPEPRGHDEVLAAGLALARGVGGEDWRRVRFNLLGTEAEAIECVRDGVRWHLSTADHISREIFATGGFQSDEVQAMIRWLDAERPSSRHPLVVEVGANIGTTTVPFARSGRRVLAIEPGPRMYQLLARTIAANGLDTLVTTVETAVGREAAMAVLAIEPWNLGGSELVVDGHVSFLSGAAPAALHEVSVRPLDGIVHDHAGLSDLDEVAMVWSDAQGSEADVVESGAALWEAGVPLYCEFWPAALRDHGGLDRFLTGVEHHFAEFADARELAAGRLHWRPVSEVAPLAHRLVTLERDESYTDLLLRGRGNAGGVR